jgi:hypothetical protein
MPRFLQNMVTQRSLPPSIWSPRSLQTWIIIPEDNISRLLFIWAGLFLIIILREFGGFINTNGAVCDSSSAGIVVSWTVKGLRRYWMVVLRA